MSIVEVVVAENVKKEIACDAVLVSFFSSFMLEYFVSFFEQLWYSKRCFIV